jgi:hypothetical protein
MTGVSRAGFYRSRLPRLATPVEMEIRDEMQKIAVESPAMGIAESQRNYEGVASISITSGCCA